MTEDPTPCLIVECSDVENWPSLFTREPVRPGHSGPVRMPDARRPAILQPDLPTAEAEAKRLALAHPDGRFVIFKAAAAAVTSEVPTHTTVSGKPWGARRVAVLLDIGEDDGIPF